MAFTLPELSYEYDGLQPYIDAETMRIHHTKHHNAYINNLNAAIEGTEFANMTIEEILLSETTAAVITITPCFGSCFLQMVLNLQEKHWMVSTKNGDHLMVSRRLSLKRLLPDLGPDGHGLL